MDGKMADDCATTNTADKRRRRIDAEGDDISTSPPPVKSLTAFAIEGPLCDDDNHFIHFFFQSLALAGDGIRIFVARRVCKRWKSYIDGMSPAQYADIYRAASANRVLADFISSNLGPKRFCLLLNESTNMAMADELRTTLARTAGSTDPIGIDPLLWVLLGQLVQVALESAQKGERFSVAFDNAWRGYAYYAVYCSLKSKSASRENENTLSEWWSRTLLALQTRVQERLADATISQRQAARASIENFVDKMLQITFHSSHSIGMDVPNPFRLASEQRLSHWNWPGA